MDLKRELQMGFPVPEEGPGHELASREVDEQQLLLTQIRGKPMYLGFREGIPVLACYLCS